MRSGGPPSPRLRRARFSLHFALPTKRRLERVTRLELATSSLARRCSTTELHPRERDRNNAAWQFFRNRKLIGVMEWRSVGVVQKFNPITPPLQHSISPSPSEFRELAKSGNL